MGKINYLRLDLFILTIQEGLFQIGLLGIQTRIGVAPWSIFYLFIGRDYGRAGERTVELCILGLRHKWNCDEFKHFFTKKRYFLGAP